MKKKDYLILSIIALSFLWTGSAYISVVYLLMESYTALDVDIYHVIIGYLLQAFGMLFFALVVRRNPDIRIHKRYFAIILIAEAAVIAAIMLSKRDALSFGLAFAMNLLHGMVAGFYLTLLSSFVHQQYRGRVFGFGYAVGSVGSWILSLPFGGRFLRMPGIVIVYAFLIGITLLLTSRLANDSFISHDTFSKDIDKPKTLKNIFMVLVILSLVKNLGFYFPASDVLGIINLEFSRAFYAVGLIAAGIISDIDRKYGAICCFAALSFSYISFVLKSNPGLSSVVWILGYVFFGFFAVYRVVVFSDIASKKATLLPLATFGLMAGRIGDSLGTLGGVLLSENIVLLLLVTSSLFIVLVFMFFSQYNKLYMPNLTESERQEKRYEDYEIKFAFSRRECEVFRLLVQGFSNTEISVTLYISESTVKYHVGNILKKSGCSNRTDLTMMFKGS
ncbi:MAG: helix-turn-helix domain-containing protein [Acetivibrionales bacterium]